MAGRTDFTDDEWAALQKGLMGAALLVSLADRHFFDTFKEAGAIAKHLQGAHEKSSSTLVRELAAVRHTRFGLSERPETVERETLEALRSSIETLNAKAPDEVEAYQNLVIDVAQSVAEAARGLDAGESAALDTIRSAFQAT